MNSKSSVFFVYRLVLVAAFVMSAPNYAFADLDAPSFSATGDYTLTWTSFDSETFTLKERLAGGTYSTIYVGTGNSKSVTGRSDGAWEYEVSYQLCFMSCTTVSYGTASVVVNSNPMPPEDFRTQIGYDFEARYGDINSDGKTDIFIRRLNIGTPNTGVLEKVILLGQATGSEFTYINPSAAQATTAATWPIATVELTVMDFNSDGYVDVAVNNVDSVISGHNDTVVYSAAEPYNTGSKHVLNLDAEVDQFYQEIALWKNDHDYFDNNAVWVPPTGGGVTYAWVCDWVFLGYDFVYQCGWVPVWVQGYPGYWDYSAFSQDALALSDVLERIAQGEQVGVIDEVRAILESVFGVEIGIFDFGTIFGNTDTTDRNELYSLALAILSTRNVKDGKTPDCRNSLENYWGPRLLQYAEPIEFAPEADIRLDASFSEIDDVDYWAGTKRYSFLQGQTFEIFLEEPVDISDDINGWIDMRHIAIGYKYAFLGETGFGALEYIIEDWLQSDSCESSWALEDIASNHIGVLTARAEDNYPNLSKGEVAELIVELYGILLTRDQTIAIINNAGFLLP